MIIQKMRNSYGEIALCTPFLSHASFYAKSRQVNGVLSKESNTCDFIWTLNLWSSLQWFLQIYHRNWETCRLGDTAYSPMLPRSVHLQANSGLMFVAEPPFSSMKINPILYVRPGGVLFQGLLVTHASSILLQLILIRGSSHDFLRIISTNSNVLLWPCLSPCGVSLERCLHDFLSGPSSLGETVRGAIHLLCYTSVHCQFVPPSRTQYRKL